MTNARRQSTETDQIINQNTKWMDITEQMTNTHDDERKPIQLRYRVPRISNDLPCHTDDQRMLINIGQKHMACVHVEGIRIDQRNTRLTLLLWCS